MLRSKAKWEFLLEENEQNNQSQSTIIDILLSQRGITTSEAIEHFISPDLSHLLSPRLLSMIEVAGERIKHAIEKKEKILIYGDYDADGVCSTVVLLKTLKELGANCDFYIPNRFDEGYGLNIQACQYAYDNEFRLIITVDTGIASHDEVQFANTLGLDVIITDHHDVQETLPDALAIIHPQCSSEYDFKSLAGVGVAFKLAEHLLGYFPNFLLDLVAIGTIADLVPLKGENRILAKFGLEKLTDTTNKGLIALKKACDIQGVVTEEDVGFRIAPRINAVGRLSDADLAVKLLMSENDIDAEKLTTHIDRLNEERKQIVQSMVIEAEEQIKDHPKKNVIMITKPNWHEGVLGIVASRLAQKYHRPAFLLTINEETNELKGSARSIPAFNLFNCCMEIRSLFSNFGGHSQAAGMTFPIENKEEILNHLNETMGTLNDDDLKETIKVNKTLSIKDVSEEMVDEINKLAPFGMGNPKPIFHIKDIPDQLQLIGRMKDHLKLQYHVNEQKFEGIGFGMGEVYSQISPHAKISIVGNLGINEWNGFKNVQMMIQDIRIKEWQLFDHRGKKDFDPMPYIKDKNNCIIIDERTNSRNTDEIEIITYDSDFSKLPRIKQLFLFQIPSDITHLEKLISVTKPEQVHACFYVASSAYLKTFPTREEFKWLYGYILKKKEINIRQEIPIIMKFRGWTKERVIFMLHVFIDLQFIHSDRETITIAPNPIKNDLKESKVYKMKEQEVEIERLLYYSNYSQLKKLFSQWISHNVEEEIKHGL